MSPTINTKSFEKKWYGKRYHLCMDAAEHQILGGKHFLILGPESGKILWLRKVQYFQKKVPSPMDCLAWRETHVIFSKSWQSFASTGVDASLAWASGSYRMASTHSSWREQK